MPTPTATVWTGNAGNGLWSDPGNWTNGVPVSGEFYTVDGQDEATIDAVATTVVIAGVQAVQDLIVDTANPASGAAVELTGSLSLAYDAVGNSLGYNGTLDLQSGTFRMVGG